MNGQFQAFCLCGGTLTGDVWPPEHAEELGKLWRDMHKGEGHGPTSQSIARTIRRHKESGQLELPAAEG